MDRFKSGIYSHLTLGKKANYSFNADDGESLFSPVSLSLLSSRALW